MRALLVLVVLAGCDRVEAPAPCDPAAWSEYVGQTVSALPALPDPTRVIEPGTAITMDLNPRRLNVKVDADGIVTEFGCY